MATLIDTLKSQGRATDYYSRKGLYESMGLDKQYGAYKGSAQQNIGFQNVLSGGNPSPSQAQGTTKLASVTSPNAPGQTNVLSGVNMSGLTPNERQYIQAFNARPSSGALYDQYASEMGLNQSADLVTGLSRTVMDLEKKISDIEPMITRRAQDFVITEGQRGRMVNAEQKPLRDQYLEAARQLNYAEAGLGAKKDLLATRLKYATDEANRPLELLKEIIGFQKSGGAGLDYSSLLDDNPTEPIPTTPPGQSGGGEWEVMVNPQSKLTDNTASWVKPQTTANTKSSDWEIVTNPQSKTTDNVSPWVKSSRKKNYANKK